MARAPRPRAIEIRDPSLLLLLGVGVGLPRGRGQRGPVREFWAAGILLLLHVGVVLGAGPDWETPGAQFSINRQAYKVF